MSGLPKRVEVVRRSARLERALAIMPRTIAIGAIAITSLIGARELVAPRDTAAPSTGPVVSDHALENFAQGFARAYLTYDSARPALRERALAPFAADELDSGAGFLPARGSQRVSWTRVAQNQEALAGGRIVVVAAGIVGERLPIYLAVPVARAGDGAIGLTGYPSLVGPPVSSRPEMPARDEVSAPDIVAVAERVVTNYLAGERDDLAADLAPDAPVSLPAQRLEVADFEEVVWADGHESGAVLATVTAADGRGGSWTLTYELGVERLAGRVVVSFVETLANET